MGACRGAKEAANEASFPLTAVEGASPPLAEPVAGFHIHLWQRLSINGYNFTSRNNSHPFMDTSLHKWILFPYSAAFSIHLWIVLNHTAFDRVMRQMANAAR